MANGRLTEQEAINGTIERWLGAKVRDLSSKYDVDPRRWYEVWRGEAYPNARSQAYEILADKYPEIAKETDPSFLKPKFKMVPRGDSKQLDFFG
ncbi:hypothetical protein [Roseibium sp. MB-4]